ncbi:MAG: ribbon-helix-helix protein, CopG family [Gemmatimonadaceae bacterium]
MHGGRRRKRDPGKTVSSWWRQSTLERVDALVERERIPRSAFIEEAVLRELERCEAGEPRDESALASGATKQVA